MTKIRRQAILGAGFSTCFWWMKDRRLQNEWPKKKQPIKTPLICYDLLMLFVGVVFAKKHITKKCLRWINPFQIMTNFPHVEALSESLFSCNFGWRFRCFLFQTKPTHLRGWTTPCRERPRLGPNMLLLAPHQWHLEQSGKTPWLTPPRWYIGGWAPRTKRKLVVKWPMVWS